MLAGGISCSTAPADKSGQYQAEQFEGRWVVVGNTYDGVEYEAKSVGDRLVATVVTSLSCMPAGSISFNGVMSGDEISGPAEFCVAENERSNATVTLAIQNTSSLTARVSPDGGIRLPGIKLERVIRVTQ